MRILFALFLLSANVSAEPLILESGVGQTTLVELYTSEGCSSCPPADRWLSQFVESDRLWQEVIPLSFHVDYWNYLGWKDEYANKAFSTRQREHKRQGSVNAVYTSATVINGQEWRGLFDREPFPSPSRQQPGNLQLRLEGSRVAVSFAHAEAKTEEALIGNIVLLGTGIQSSIARGENAGRILNHDFVVLHHESQAANDGLWIFEINPTEEATAVAAWVSKAQKLPPIQAVGGWLPN